MNKTNPLLRREEVQELLGITKSFFYNLLRSGKLPKPVELGPQSPRWRLSEINEYIDSLERRTGEAP